MGTFKSTLRKHKRSEDGGNRQINWISKISPNRDITNALLGATIVGGTCYLHTRKHMVQITDCKKNLLFCPYGSAMVTMGSVLLWAMLKAVMPENPALRTAVAVGSSVVLLKTGAAYIEAVDNLVEKSSK